MSLLQDLTELEKAGVITRENANQIVDYYKKKEAASPTANKQLFVFGVLGALLVGIGLMFIIANQWDSLSRNVKTTCAFLLLIVPQLLCLFALVKKADKIVWLESTALLLFFAVGANISLVGQIFHINGDASTFLLTWMLLTVPLVFIMRSSAVSLAYFIGLLFYSFAVRTDATELWSEWIYWPLLALPLPRYLQLFKKSPESPLFILHHWVIPFVLTLTIGMVSHNSREWLPPVFILLFGIFNLIGNQSFFASRALIKNGYKVFGYCGTVITLLVMTFKSNWKELLDHHYTPGFLISSSEFIALIILGILASLLLIRSMRGRTLADLKMMEIAWLLFLAIFVLGLFTSVAVLLVNLFVFAAAVMMIREGSRQSHLGVLNSGMVVVALLVACRSFDADLTFVVKGVLFVLVGIGFFVTNWLTLKKRNQNER